jgi:response regulator RpfG family c-di-GMP phosphodiesterase
MAKRKVKYRNVFIIDDSEMDNMLNKMILEVADYSTNIATFSYPGSALQYLKNIKSTEEVPDLIYLDINMPEMDGFEFMEEFEKLPSKVSRFTKVIIISSSDDPIDIEKASRYKSIVKYLKKPLNMKELY